MADRLEALFVNEGALGFGVMGHARAAEVLERQLRGHDVEARFVSLPPLGRVAAAATRGIPGLGTADLDLHPVRWHVTHAVRARRRIASELRRRPADVLHLHTHGLAFLSAGEMRRVPTLLAVDATAWQWHAMGIYRRLRRHSRATLAPSLAMERRALRRAATVLAFSRWSRRGVEEAAPGAHVVEHHPGIDLDEFRPAPRRPRSRPRVLFVGGRFAQKGGDDLLAALGRHAGRELDLDLVTPAEVAQRDGVRVHRLAPSDPELLDLYQQADVFCLPTRGDAVPFAVLEAMGCGTPVVASRIGGIADMLDEGRAGRLVAPGDVRGLAGAVRELLGDELARHELGERGRRRCEEHYDARRQVLALIEIMRAAAARAGEDARAEPR
jgi:glycosyltransferase involved in cell wall biosynthesis